MNPRSSLKQTKKQQTLSKTPSGAPQSFSKLLNFGPKEENDSAESGGGDGDGDGDAAVKGTLLAGLLIVGAVGGFGAVGYLYKEQINAFLTQFSSIIDGIVG